MKKIFFIIILFLLTSCAGYVGFEYQEVPIYSFRYYYPSEYPVVIRRHPVIHHYPFHHNHARAYQKRHRHY